MASDVKLEISPLVEIDKLRMRSIRSLIHSLIRSSIRSLIRFADRQLVRARFSIHSTNPDLIFSCHPST